MRKRRFRLLPCDVGRLEKALQNYVEKIKTKLDSNKKINKLSKKLLDASLMLTTSSKVKPPKFIGKVLPGTLVTFTDQAGVEHTRFIAYVAIGPLRHRILTWDSDFCTVMQELKTDSLFVYRKRTYRITKIQDYDAGKQWLRELGEERQKGKLALKLRVIKGKRRHYTSEKVVVVSGSSSNVAVA